MSTPDYVEVLKHGDSVTLSSALTALTTRPDDPRSEDQLWYELALDFLRVVTPALIWRRDNEDVDLYSNKLWTHMNFESVIAMASEESTLPEDLRQPLHQYLKSLHGYNEIKKFTPFDENYMVAMQQHGYRTMIFWRPLETIYGY